MDFPEPRFDEDGDLLYVPKGMTTNSFVILDTELTAYRFLSPEGVPYLVIESIDEDGESVELGWAMDPDELDRLAAELAELAAAARAKALAHG